MSTGGGNTSQFSGQLQLDWQEFVSGLKEAVKGVQELSQAWSDAARDVADAAFNVVASVAAVGTGITAAIATMGTSFLAMEENSMIAFNTLLKDGDKAKAMFEDLVKLGAELPGFSTAAMVDAGKSLLNQRFAAEQVIPLLTAVADQTAAMGGGQEVFDKIIKGLAQIKGKGKLSAEEMTQQLGEVMPAWAYLAEFLGTDVASAQAMVTAGQVDADTAIKALTAGMQQLGGTAKKMGGTFSGLWAGIADQADITAGMLFRPMYNALKGVMQEANALMDSGAFNEGLEKIRKNFDKIAKSVTAWFQANGAQAMDDLIAGYNQFLTVVADISKWVVEASPKIREFAAALWTMLEPIVAFVGKHPEILAALALWKAASLMGITTAVASLTTALWSTARAAPAAAAGLRSVVLAAGPQFIAGLRAVSSFIVGTLIPNVYAYSSVWIAQLRLIISQSGALSLAFKGLVIGGGTLAGLWAMYKVLDMIEGKVKSTAELLSEQSDMLSKMASKTEVIIQDAMQDGNFDQAIAEQKKLIEELTFRHAAEQKTADDAKKDQTEKQKIGAGAARLVGQDLITPDSLQKQADETLKALNDATVRMQRVEVEVQRAKANAAKEQAALAGVNTIVGAPNAAALDPKAMAQALADKTAKGQSMLAQQQREVAGRGLPSGFGQMREFMDLGPAEDLMRQYAANFEGASPQLVQALITGMTNAMKTGTYTTDVADALAREFFEGIADSEAAAEAAAEAMRQLSDDFEQMADKIQQQRIAGNLTAMQEVYYLDIANQLLGARQQGVITEAQYLQGQRNLNAHLEYAGNILQQTRGGVEQFLGTLLQLKTSGQITDAQFAAFEARMDALAFATKTGEMSLDQFNVSMQELAAEARMAAEDADRRKQLGQLAKLTEGMEEGPFKRAVEQRLLSWLQQQQGAQADAFTQNLLRMNGIMPFVSEGLNGMKDKMVDFGRGLSSQFGFGGGSGQSGVDTMNRLGQFFNSLEGRIASVQHAIQFGWQRYSILKRVDGVKAQAQLDAIKAMQSQLQMLLTPQESPLVDSGMILEDPGLVTENAKGPTEMKVDITLPNVSRLTNQDVRTIVVALRDEAKRTGGRLWD